MKRKLLAFLLIGLFAVTSAMAQNKTITGRVVGADDGLPLPGVSVRVKGGTAGTSTGIDGNFSLSAPNNASVLTFTYIGYVTQEISIGSDNRIDVKLETDSKLLSEVVVVGYSTTTKEAFTGSAKVVSGEDLNRKSVSNVSQALAGEVAGVRIINTSGQPGTEATIRVRGLGSVNGNRAPLYVVDGVPFTGSLNSINPGDIASVTVLKDAAATAIYGSRGSNGVIVVTTRTGANKASFIEVDGQSGTNMALIPRYDVIRSPEQFIALGWEALYNQGVSVKNANPEAYANARLFSSAGISPNNNIWKVANGGELIDPVTRTVKSGVTRKYDPENWEDYAFQNSARNEVNVKMGGSQGKTNYYTSFGYLNDKGYSINSDYERLSARLNVNHEVKSWLNANANFGYARTETNRAGQTEDSGSIFWFVDNIPSIYPLFMKDKTGQNVIDPIFGGPQYDYGSTGRKFGSLTNAIADATYNKLRDKRNELNGSASLNFNIVNGLTLENRIGAQFYNNGNLDYSNKYYGSAASQNGSIFQRKTELFSYNLLNLLRYTKSFGNHNLVALAAHESTDWSQNILTVSAFNLVDDNIEDFNNAVVSNPIASYTNAYKLDSYFSQLTYDYNEKYFLSGSIRRDGSSRFVKNKWGTFGSIGAAWLISKESFMDNQKIFNSLKLKASYGLIGDQAGVGYYPGYDLYNVDNLNDSPAFSFATKGNPDLTWETSKMFQTGVEFSIGNYLTGSVDYYVKNTDNLIFDRRVGPSIGYALITVNDGRLRNKGLEFDLTGSVLKKKDYYLNLTLNGEIFKNEITQMPIEPSTGLNKVIDVQGNYGWGKGRSVYDFYMREYAGVDPADGKSMWTLHYKDANSNNAIDAGEAVTNVEDYIAKNPGVTKEDLKSTTTKTYSSASLKYLDKSAIPKIRGAFNLSAGYKGIELGVQMLYSFGGYSYDFAYAGLMSNGLIGGNNWNTDILRRWQKAGDITDVPRLSNNADANVNAASSRFVTKANYISLNNVRLGYNIPNKYLSDLGVAGVSLWVSGDNLWLNSTRNGFNPSTAESGASSRYSYSPLSTVTAGLRVKL